VDKPIVVVTTSEPETKTLIEVDYAYLGPGTNNGGGAFVHQTFYLDKAAGDSLREGGDLDTPDVIDYADGGDVVVAPGWLWRAVREIKRHVKVKQTVPA
jgi:hypothetical protein